MEQKLKAELRRESGKGPARRIRAAGRVPAVVYGHGSEPLLVTVDGRELFHLLHTDAGMNVLVDMRVDHERFLAMPREVQRDHLRDAFVHVDFLRVARDERISVEVPIQLVGESRGVKEGGVIEHHIWSLHVECLPQDVPSAIEADISEVGINEALKVGDLRLPDRVTLQTAPTETIVSVVPPQVLRVEEELGLEAPPGAAEDETAGAEGGPARGAQG